MKKRMKMALALLISMLLCVIPMMAGASGGSPPIAYDLAVYAYQDSWYSTPVGVFFSDIFATAQPDYSDWGAFQQVIYATLGSNPGESDLIGYLANFYETEYGTSIPYMLYGLSAGHDVMFTLSTAMAPGDNHLTMIFTPYILVEHAVLGSPGVNMGIPTSVVPILAAPQVNPSGYAWNTLQWDEILRNKTEAEGSWMLDVPRTMAGYRFLGFSTTDAAVDGLAGSTPAQHYASAGNNVIYALYEKVAPTPTPPQPTATPSPTQDPLPSDDASTTGGENGRTLQPSWFIVDAGTAAPAGAARTAPKPQETPSQGKIEDQVALIADVPDREGGGQPSATPAQVVAEAPISDEEYGTSKHEDVPMPRTGTFPPMLALLCLGGTISLVLIQAKVYWRKGDFMRT